MKTRRQILKTIGAAALLPLASVSKAVATVVGKRTKPIKRYAAVPFYVPPDRACDVAAWLAFGERQSNQGLPNDQHRVFRGVTPDYVSNPRYGQLYLSPADRLRASRSPTPGAMHATAVLLDVRFENPNYPGDWPEPEPGMYWYGEGQECGLLPLEARYHD